MYIVIVIGQITNVFCVLINKITLCKQITVHVYMLVCVLETMSNTTNELRLTSWQHGVTSDDNLQSLWHE